MKFNIERGSKLVKDIRKDVAFFYKSGKMVCCKTATDFQIDNQHLLDNYDIHYLTNFLINNGFIRSEIKAKMEGEKQ